MEYRKDELIKKMEKVWCKLSPFFSYTVNGVTQSMLLIVWDEARILVNTGIDGLPESSLVSIFRLLRRALRLMGRHGTPPVLRIFSLFTDTSSRLANFQPRNDTDSSRAPIKPRIGELMFRPIVLMPSLDAAARTMTITCDPNTAKHPKRLIRLGRIAWHVMEKKKTPIDILELAVSKLFRTARLELPELFARESREDVKLKMLACLGPRLAIQMGPYVTATNGPLVRRAGFARERESGDDHRGAVVGFEPSPATCLDRGRCSAVWLLPVGTADERGCAVATETQAQGRRHRSGDDGEYLPLRDLSADSSGHPSGCRDGGEGRRAMSTSKTLPTIAASMPRRDFLKFSVAASGGLLIGFHFSGIKALASPQTAAAASFMPNAFVRIGTDERVTVIVNHSEMGQGVYTSLPMLLAEELDADWSKVGYESAPVDAKYNHPAFGMQITGGSSSVWSGLDQFRQAGAAARAMLVAAAAQQWNTDVANCRTELGAVYDTSNRKLTYGQLVGAAAKVAPPEHVQLKDPKTFKLIGKPIKRLDTPEKLNGGAVFGIDVKLPGMLTAVIARPPIFGAKMTGFDDSRARSMPGVRKIVAVPAGIAVIADTFWQAKMARDAVRVDWDEGSMRGFNSSEMLQQWREQAKTPGTSVRNDGDAGAALATAAKKIEAMYEAPYLSHLMMEPLNCAVDLRADSCRASCRALPPRSATSTVYTGTRRVGLRRQGQHEPGGRHGQRSTARAPVCAGHFWDRSRHGL